MLIRLYRRLTGQHGLEECFYIECARALEASELQQLEQLITGPFDEISNQAFIGDAVEVGPRLSVETPFSSNAVDICNSMGLPVTRIERSTRYQRGPGLGISSEMNEDEIIQQFLDPLTQEIYPNPIETFASQRTIEPVISIPILTDGEQALVVANIVLGLGMDKTDIEYYTEMFRRLGRNPTDVELFQIGNGNSEHSRHHFFRGIQVIDGVEAVLSLMDIVKAPWQTNPGNSLVAFHDNSGVMRLEVYTTVIRPVPDKPGFPSRYFAEQVLLHATATAETHNHPTLIAPFPGANTGAGGRIRDNRAVGRGGLTHAGFAGYAVGNLHIPGYVIPGEIIGGESVTSHASPLDILLRGSDGLSDYGNKIGEPLIGGFTRSFGQTVRDQRREFRKPVLYSAGVGRLDDRHLRKHEPEIGMRIVRIGGPAYRIGVGGGSASSMIQGENASDLDLKSVQRGNPEMENRVNRVIQVCAEMGNQNPIESIHDQGAGGPSNVLTELMEPAGGRVDIRKIAVGDQTMSVLEIWVAEYQEGYGLLIRPENLEVFQAICERERVNCEVLGEITGDGNVVVVDSSDNTTPVNLSLSSIMGDVPRKRFVSDRISSVPVSLPVTFKVTVTTIDWSRFTLGDLLKTVLALPQVGSKGFLVRKVDRSVTGLVAQQQCCGEMQVPVADVAVTADGYFGLTGVATAIGEQPIKMLVNPAAGARMAVAEMLTNLASARISQLSDVKGRANWMMAAKLPHEGANLYDAAFAMSDLMCELGIAIDGGKDSLSMATRVGDEPVVSPGELVVLGYAPVPDITMVATPDFKGDGFVFMIDLGNGKNRLGGSSLYQAFGEIGIESPDIDTPGLLKRAFDIVQRLIGEGVITAYHDRSDGGLISALVEMCIAGNCGLTIGKHSPMGLAELFSEEAGMIFEVSEEMYDDVLHEITRYFEMPLVFIGTTRADDRRLYVFKDEEVVLEENLTTLRSWWEATSTELEALQANPETVQQEEASFKDEKGAEYQLTFIPRPTKAKSLPLPLPKVAVLREEGTNGDREMAAACVAAGFEPWDITMSDLLSGKITSFDDFQMLAYPGGFSFADTFGSAKGWAGTIREHAQLRDMFDRFYDRKDTISLGVCNGCQLMSYLDVLPWKGIEKSSQPRFIQNTSGRFESRWSTVRILPSPSIFFSGMEGSILGIHVAHGEGRLVFPDRQIGIEAVKQELVPLAFVGPNGLPTDAYPYNPNGSTDGYTALCSPNGRHLAMMPHPERCFLSWQWPWMPQAWRASLEASPWLQMFQNAHDWCLQHQ